MATADVLPCSTMRKIGVRELRQHASKWLREVQQGESFEITDRGRTVARLVPPADGSLVESLIASGRLIGSRGTVNDMPLPLDPVPGVPLPSEELQALRADER